MITFSSLRNEIFFSLEHSSISNKDQKHLEQFWSLQLNYNMKTFPEKKKKTLETVSEDRI